MLSDEERAILDFEGAWWQSGGPKDPMIESALGVTSAGYYEILSSLLSSADAFAYAPFTVRRAMCLLDSAMGESGVAG